MGCGSGGRRVAVNHFSPRIFLPSVRDFRVFDQINGQQNSKRGIGALARAAFAMLVTQHAMCRRWSATCAGCPCLSFPRIPSSDCASRRQTSAPEQHGRLRSVPETQGGASGPGETHAGHHRAHHGNSRSSSLTPEVLRSTTSGDRPLRRMPLSRFFPKIIGLPCSISIVVSSRVALSEA